MAFDTHLNFSVGTVKTAPAPSTTGQTVGLMPGDGQFFAAGMPVTLCPDNLSLTAQRDQAEIGYLTAVDGDVLTVTRGQEGSTAMQVEAGWKVIGSVTAKSLTDIETAVDGKVAKVTGKGLSANDYSDADKSKLAGIATGATANDTDSNLKNRANHTGTQAISTISDVTATAAEVNVLDGITATTAELNYTDGVTSSIQAQLDAKLPVSGDDDGDIYVDYIGGKTDSNVDFDVNGNFLGTLKQDGTSVSLEGHGHSISDVTSLQTTLDGKQGSLTLTTTGTSGAATLTGSTLNIPQYEGSGGASDWGDIGGTLSDQTDLQTALDAKADDDSVMHTSGDETIYGAKEFKDDVEIEGALTMGGNIVMNGTDVIIQPGGKLIGWIDEDNFTDLEPVYTLDSEKGWAVTGLRVKSGRFDFDAFEGKSEFNIYDMSSGQLYFTIEPDRDAKLYRSLDMTNDGWAAKSIKIAGANYGGYSADNLHLYLADGANNGSAGAGGGMAFRARNTTGNDAYTDQAFIKGMKANGTSGDNKADLSVATHNGSALAEAARFKHDGKLEVAGDSVRVKTSRTPSSATATGAKGEIVWDANYVYVCVDTDTWKRAALSSW